MHAYVHFKIAFYSSFNINLSTTVHLVCFLVIILSDKGGFFFLLSSGSDI